MRKRYNIGHAFLTPFRQPKRKLQQIADKAREVRIGPKILHDAGSFHLTHAMSLALSIEHAQVAIATSYVPP